MTNRKTVFRFKQFECSHSRSSMKIGVDAVLIGAWADLTGAGKILDVGTGCGVIALMCAQRNPASQILSIDIDNESIEEASLNFKASPWADRITASLSDFNEIKGESYDLIISNPPYFHSGIDSPDSPRLKARHEDSLSPSVIISKGVELISDTGRIVMVIPAERLDSVVQVARQSSLRLNRLCYIKGHKDAPVKRVLIDFKKVPKSDISNDSNLIGNETDLNPIETETLILEESPGHPTPRHRALCSPFYLYY